MDNQGSPPNNSPPNNNAQANPAPQTVTAAGKESKNKNIHAAQGTPATVSATGGGQNEDVYLGGAPPAPAPKTLWERLDPPVRVVVSVIGALVAIGTLALAYVKLVGGYP